MVSDRVLREVISGDSFREKKRVAAVQTDARRDVFLDVSRESGSLHNSRLTR